MSHGTNLSDIGDAFVHFEFVPQGLLSFYWLATQLSWSEEFELASLASRQKWRLAQVKELKQRGRSAVLSGP